MIGKTTFFEEKSNIYYHQAVQRCKYVFVNYKETYGFARFV